MSPSPEQERQFVQFAGCRRFVWNWALARKQAVYKATGKGLGFNALCAELVALKKTPEAGFLRECHSQVLQQTMRDLEGAYTAFFEKRAKFPKFKSRKKSPHAFRFPQCASIDGDGRGVHLPKIGRVKAIIHRAAEGTIKSATIKQEAGAWYIVFVSHVDLPDVPPSCSNPVGLDMGLESFVTLSTGEKVKPPKFYREAERKLARLARQHSRCEKQSRRRAKAKARLARFQARTANKRRDWLHKLSARIVAEHDTICVEDLNLKGLTKTKLAKSFHDAGIGEFLRHLTYKASWRAGQVFQVGRFFPSSKTCNACGVRAVLTLSDREWTCGGCGSRHDRDINAAVNILREGLSTRLAACASSKKLKTLADGIPDSLNALGADVRPAMAGSQQR